MIITILGDPLKKMLQVPLLGYRTLCLWHWSDIINSFLTPPQGFLCSFSLPITLKKPPLLFTHTFLWWAGMCIKSTRFTFDTYLWSPQLFKMAFRAFSFLKHWVLKCVWVRKDIGLPVNSSCLLWNSSAPRPCLTVSDLSSVDCWMCRMN